MKIVIAAIILNDEVATTLEIKQDCNACNQNCRDEHAEEECYSCGHPVCKQPGCSLVTEYLRFGEQRVCIHCLEQRWDETPALKEALHRIYYEQGRGAGVGRKAAQVQADLWMEDAAAARL